MSALPLNSWVRGGIPETCLRLSHYMYSLRQIPILKSKFNSISWHEVLFPCCHSNRVASTLPAPLKTIKLLYLTKKWSFFFINCQQRHLYHNSKEAPLVTKSVLRTNYVDGMPQVLILSFYNLLEQDQGSPSCLSMTSSVFLALWSCLITFPQDMKILDMKILYP